MTTHRQGIAMQLGMVGLGRMGANMVRRCLRAGHSVVVFDRDAAAVAALAAEGATGAASLEELVAGIERLWEVSEPVLREPPPVQLYEPGSWGPASVDELIAPRRWHLPGERS